MLNTHRIEQALSQTRRLGKVLYYFEQLDSTNSEIFRATHLPEGAVILAEFQTAGRGRAGKVWHSPMGENLLFSVLLRPACETKWLGLLSIMASEAIAETAEFLTTCTATVKYPNDVYVSGKKLAGVLVETRTQGLRAPTVALGIGLNVNQTAFEGELSERATSLRLIAQRELDRAAVLTYLLQCLDARYDEFIQGRAELFLERWKARCQIIGKEVSFRYANAELSGKVVAIDEQGCLWIESNTQRICYAPTDISYVRY
ncbi:MAG: biotin--[acetyl-CoA-carboxylase] ligase [Chloroherpetonaceae bacterium]|nr:biotin--[acetyl-CoA-carboxylase] ligase [Chloroherpetonaceae bacterium]MDW8466777.1 biotin--[acetyl-CoA-carboxylase] ligase [Chloroherpetonaceae bacterium]